MRTRVSEIAARMRLQLPIQASMPQFLDWKRIPLAGYPICSTTAVSLNSYLQLRLDASKKTALLFANTNFVLKCLALRSWLSNSDIVLVNDGIGLDLAAFLLYRQRYTENLNGTDFVPYFLGNCTVPKRVFLLGAKPGVAEKAGVVIEEIYHHVVAGSLNGYEKMETSYVLKKINASCPDIVLIAMGNPLQEEWIRDNMHALDAPMFVGVGALFDFLSGGVARAPLWVQRIRCEWLFRLCQEPRRLIRRYTLDIVVFLVVCLRYKKSESI